MNGMIGLDLWQISRSFVKFEFPPTVIMKSSIFWWGGGTSYSPLKVNRGFGGKCAVIGLSHKDGNLLNRSFRFHNHLRSNTALVLKRPYNEADSRMLCALSRQLLIPGGKLHPDIREAEVQS
jgi:hypothetical protein